jgi:hypothetical protein
MTAPLKWPCGTPKSQHNAFTSHLTDPRLTIRMGGAKTGPKPGSVQTRYQQDPGKAAINL